MFCSRVVSSLIRLSSPRSLSSAATLGSVNNPHADIDIANEVNNDDILEANPPEGKKFVRKITRPRYAMLLSFHGAQYFGMQFNVHGPAIENKLFEALIKMDIIPEEHSKRCGYYLEFRRASRTDRGVSALRQVVSLRITKGKSIDGINELLPDDIRVLGMKRVAMNFDAQKFCDSRSYSYIMPTFALCDYSNICDPCQNYRIDADTLLKTSQIFQMFRGSHKFHNYTERRDIWDQRSMRKILETHISNPFLMGNIEMIEFKIRGHSFMLHQIRRMIGMTIAIMRGKAPFHLLEESFEHPMMPAPTAPALGLLLEKQHFSGYQSRYGDTYPMEWDEFDADVEKFKLEKIVPYMLAVEQEQQHMENFLNQKLKKHCFKSKPESSRLYQLGQWDKEDLKQLLNENVDSNSKEEQN